jgi:hypothetical protein
MKELSSEARGVLERGLALDGPSATRRARVKQRVLAAVGGGALTLGGAAAAGAAGGIAGGAGLASAKGLVAGSLLIWFGVGAAAGVGVSGVVALVEHRATVGAVPTAAHPRADARATRGESDQHASAPGSHDPSEPSSEPEQRGNGTVAASPTAAPRPSHPVPPTLGEMPAPVASAAPVPSTLREEAALLQRAQRALAAKDPELALSLLTEHERRFSTGALGEERQAAKILALCALGRVGEARTLARAFVAASPRSVLVPHLQRSCALP